MVFGWGKKNQTSDDQIEVVTSTNSEITLSEIPNILNDIEQLRQKTLIAEIKTFRNKIDTDRKNLLSIANQLKNDNLKTDDMDNHLKIILSRAISDVSSTIQKEFQTSYAEIKSLNDVLEFEKKATKAIKKVVDVLRKHKTGIALFAKKYARKFKDALEILDSYLQEIKNLTANYKSNQEFLSIIRENLEKVSTTRSMISKQNKRKTELENLLQHESSKLEELSSKESKITSSPDYNEYITTKSKLDSLDSEEKQLRYSIDEHFVKISRPLNKYVHISSLDKPLKILNEKLLVSPYDVLSEVKSSDIITILNSVQASVSSGAISVKDTEKSVQQIKDVKDILSNLIKEKNDFYQNKLTYIDELKKFDFDSFKLCRDGIQKSKDEIANITTKHTGLLQQIKENVDSLSNIFSTLETSLKSASSISYKIISD
ncbi:hypothetical protein OAK01_05390 [Candidatus Nitrosopelagicus sp.]|nr:hypothetical protein [Candidatus Nitrosopelagicus sp.]